MKLESIAYQDGTTPCKGYLAYDSDEKTKRPAILVSPDYKGIGKFSIQVAQDLAKLGYIGFALDLYGNETHTDSDEEASELMLPLFLNREQLRKRMEAAYNVVKNHPQVDVNNIAAIGFCFGGTTVIELMRSGADLKGVVSFHGVLGNEIRKNKAALVPNAKKINGSLLVLHGDKDPMVSEKDIKEFKEEFDKSGVDWQMHIYGQAAHAFTNPEKHDTEKGLVYNARTSKRAFQSMRNFLEEIFTKNDK